jgi:cysteine desulfurase
MNKRPIYMDNHSTTQMDPSVLEIILPFFREKFGNAASITHAYGREARDAVEVARNHLAKLINCSEKHIVFTSGATESNNLAIKGIMQARSTGSHLIVNTAEHKAVLDPAKRLQEEGYAVSFLPVDEQAMVDPQHIADSIKPNTVLVSVMLANNEVGTINPISEIAAICRQHSVLLHTDATQAVGKIPVDVNKLGVDLLSLSAHKFHGPKGVGALFLRDGGRHMMMKCLLDGGGHERRLRSGTLPVPLVVGLGEASRLCHRSLRENAEYVAQLRDRLRTGLEQAIENVAFNGHPQSNLPGSLHASFLGVQAEALILKLQDVVAVSTGSACTTAEPEPSHVLLAMGFNDDRLHTSVRFGLSRFNTESEVQVVISEVTHAVAQLRQLQLH